MYYQCLVQENYNRDIQSQSVVGGISHVCINELEIMVFHAIKHISLVTSWVFFSGPMYHSPRITLKAMIFLEIVVTKLCTVAFVPKACPGCIQQVLTLTEVLEASEKYMAS